MVTMLLALCLVSVGVPHVMSWQPPVDPCALLTAQEVDAALGRSGSKAGQLKGEGGQGAQCRFANSQSGDVTVMLTAPSASAQEHHRLRPDTLKDEQTPFEKIPGLGLRPAGGTLKYRASRCTLDVGACALYHGKVLISHE